MRINSFSIFVLLVALSYDVAAQERIPIDIKYRARADRSEGITNLLDVSDEGIVLTGFQGIPRATVNPEKEYSVIYPLTTESPSILIARSYRIPAYPNYWYKMSKTQEARQRSFVTYSWPTKIAQKLRVDSGSFILLAQKSSGGRREVFPALLIGDNVSRNINGYTISFWPRSPADVELVILDRFDQEIWKQGILNCAADRTYSVMWDGRDANGNYVQKGRYQLQVIPRFHQTGSSEKVEGEAYVYHFEHTYTF